MTSYFDLPRRFRRRYDKRIQKNEREQAILKFTKPERDGVVRSINEITSLAKRLRHERITEVTSIMFGETLDEKLQRLTLTLLKEWQKNPELLDAIELELRYTKLALEQKKVILSHTMLRREIAELEVKTLAVTEKLLRARLLLNEKIESRMVPTSSENRKWHTIRLGAS